VYCHKLFHNCYKYPSQLRINPSKQHSSHRVQVRVQECKFSSSGPVFVGHLRKVQ
jgi:hypothetical protein